MQKTIIDLTNKEASEYFLQANNFCSIDLPKYFDFQTLLLNLKTQIGNRRLDEIRTCMPNDQENINYKFLTNKDGNFAWRPLQIINPAIYICLVNRVTEEDNWDFITKKFAYFRENKRIICYSLPLVLAKENDQIKKNISANILNWWKVIEQQSIELALQYNCVLITDITDCYSSIYTHAIGWALHGKEAARKERNNPNTTLIGCIIDRIIQAMSYRQTNGIPQGSTLMDFIAEMVLGYADSELTRRLNNLDIDYQILRYRDDYRIFANTQENAIIVAKLLSEVLSDLNLKLNTQKTYVSNNIIRDVIKPDKLYWNEINTDGKTLQKQLLLIHTLSEKYPNSGSVSTAMSNFIDDINSLNIYKEGSSRALISILVDIALKNPRTYSIVIVCIGKILSLEPSQIDRNKLYAIIKKKFEKVPNTGYWDVWFQRLLIKNQRDFSIEFREKLCQIASGKTDVELWNVKWLKTEYQQIFKENTIFNESIFKGISVVPEKNEAIIFGY